MTSTLPPGAPPPAEPVTAPRPADDAERDVGELTDDIAGSATNLVGRRIALLVISALGAIAITRLLGPVDYGQFASALATWTLLTVLADFGVSLVLARDMAAGDSDRPRLLRSAYEVGAQWSFVLTGVIVGVAVLAGPSTDRGLALLVLAPSVPTMAYVGARQVFIVLYRTGELVRIDLIVVAIQVLGQIAVAALGLGVVAVAAVVSLGTLVNALLVARAARTHVSLGKATRADRRDLRRRALPLGTMTVLSKLYLVGDLVILAWFISDSTLGDYAAAARMLTLATSLPGLITNAALPGLSSSVHDADRLRAVTTKLWHWMLMAALPVLLLMVVLPQLIVDLTIGPGYDTAATLLRVLSLAGFIGVASNFFGTLLIAKRIVRPLLWLNLTAVIFNIAAVLVLAPSQGVLAAAWVTVATEVLIAIVSATIVARDEGFAPWLAVTWRPFLAAIPAAGVGVLLNDIPLLSAAAILVVFWIVARAVGAWPAEFRLPKRFRRSAT